MVFLSVLRVASINLGGQIKVSICIVTSEAHEESKRTGGAHSGG